MKICHWIKESFLHVNLSEEVGSSPGPMCFGDGALLLELLVAVRRTPGPPFKARRTMPGYQNGLNPVLCSGFWSGVLPWPFHATLLPFLLAPPLVQTLPFLQNWVTFLGCLMVPPLPTHGVGGTPLPFCHLIHPIKQWGKAGCFLDSKYPN